MVFTLYLATAVVYLILDLAMITFISQPLFKSQIGHLMVEPLRAGPAVAYYFAYVAGVLYLVSWPALTRGTAVLLPGLVLGLMAYGTYEFTSWAIMKDWHWTLVATDTVWGGVGTGLSAWAGVAITRRAHRRRLSGRRLSGQRM